MSLFTKVICPQVQKTIRSKEQMAQVPANKNAHDNVAVIVHGKQHGEISPRKLEQVKQGAHRLLPQRGHEPINVAPAAQERNPRAAQKAVRGRGCPWLGGMRQRPKLAPRFAAQLPAREQKPVVVALQSPDQLNCHDQEDHGHAAGGKAAVAGDVPGFGNEA